MSKIIKKSKNLFVGRSGTTGMKKFAAIFDYFPPPFGLLQKHGSATLNPLKKAPLFPAGFALHSRVSATQRFHAMDL